MDRVRLPSWIGAPLILIFVVPMLVYGAYSIGDRWYQNYLLTQQEESIRRDVAHLREENLRLQRELVEARGDAAIEKIAREQLGLIRPGDTAIQIAGPPGAVAQAAQRKPEPAQTDGRRTPERPGWLRFLDGLFRR